MVPKKLKDDAIVEAVCQLQFTTSETAEVIVGRLSDFPGVDSYKLAPTPWADVPAPVRRHDQTLRFQPLLQLKGPSGKLIQVGESMVSAHVVGARAYPGWETFRVHLSDVFARLFEKLRDVRITNVSLRYINALVAERHMVPGPHGLRLQVKLGDSIFNGPINLAVADRPGGRHVVTTRIADVHFVQGELPAGATAIVDVEVTPGNAFAAKDLSTVLEWIETAHTLEKDAFFKLLPEEVVNKLKEE